MNFQPIGDSKDRIARGEDRSAIPLSSKEHVPNEAERQSAKKTPGSIDKITDLLAATSLDLLNHLAEQPEASKIDCQSRLERAEYMMELSRVALQLAVAMGNGPSNNFVPNTSVDNISRGRVRSQDHVTAEENLFCQITDAKSNMPLQQSCSKLLRTIIRQRQSRTRFFGNELFADPAWDMLLDLFAADYENSRVSVTSLCIASCVPPTTALRWIGQMADAGLVERQEDGVDRRRAFIKLSEKGTNLMHKYFQYLGKFPSYII